MIFFQTNLNNRIKFRPRPETFRIYRNHMHTILGDTFPELSRELIVQEDGLVTMQIWEFASIFGPHLANGVKCVMETKIHIEGEI